MKHRSIIAFILLAAALVAAPQVSHDLAALKSALGTRIRGEILHAFLSLHAREDAGGMTPRRAAPQLASCKAAAKSDELTASHAKQNDSRAHAAPRAEAASQREARAQLAMLIDPLLESEESSAELPGVDDQFIHGKSAKLPRRAVAPGELAMLIPPGSGIDIPALSNAPWGDARDKSAANEQRGSAESRRAASLATHFEATAASKFQGEEAFRYLGPLLRETVWVRGAENGARVRIFKVRRPAKVGGANPSATGPQPAPAALTKPLPVLPVSFQTSVGE
ncbi:MAG: hypothetical protein DMF67_00235 [Acidobacteria bacterium]|nr:MAG: hypothetical protein DMF67_00235 [Acidobacteriota bacterium]